jgi:hypothetical protein
VEDILYNDAKRRNQNLEEKQRQAAKGTRQSFVSLKSE